MHLLGFSLAGILLSFSIVRSEDVVSISSVEHCDKDGGCPPKKLTCHRILLKAKKKVTLNLINIEDKEDLENQVQKIFLSENLQVIKYY